MRRSKFAKAACVCKLCLVIVTATAVASPAKAASPFPALPKNDHEVDWIALFGTINPGTNPKVDIPVDRHTIKKDVSNILSSLCTGTSVQPSDMKLYRVDLNGDHLPDYWSDWSRFSSCQAVCDSVSGCYATGYVAISPEQIFPATPTPPPGGGTPPPPPPVCPPPTAGQTPAQANVDCVETCDATIGQCPGLFHYGFDLAWNDKILGWNIYDPAVLMATYNVGNATIRYPYYPVTQGTVIGLLLNNARGSCTNEELAINGGQCIKYYQWVSDGSGNFGNGFFKDLYVPDVSDEVNDTRGMHNFTAFNIPTRVLTRGQLFGNGTGLRFPAGTWFAIQVPDFDVDDNPNTAGEFVCWEFNNNSTQDYFVPTKTDTEINAWRRSLPTGVTTRTCRLRFSEWEGTLSCAEVAPACDQTINIFADRHCQRSTSSYTTCGECNTAGVPAGAIPGCEFRQVCYGEPCSPPPPTGDGSGDGGGGDGGGASDEDQ